MNSLSTTESESNPPRSESQLMMLSLRYSTYDTSSKNMYTKDTLFVSRSCLRKY